MTAYHKKYRPGTFEEVYGQREVTLSLEKIIERGTSHAFIFTGPAGTGKTTLARIAANELGATTASSILELDAALNTGVDDMRKLREFTMYKPLGKASASAVILDEAHRLSPNAWDALLKPMEEPPAHLYWFLCTTNAAKIPKTIKTRCVSYTLKPVADRVIEQMLVPIMKAEKIKLASGVLDLIIREAGGSPRQALVNLATCEDAEGKQEAAKLLQTVLEGDATIELCRFLMRPGSWPKAMQIMDKLKDENPEGVRIVVCNYMASVLKGCKSDKEAMRVLATLEAFSEPYNSAENAAPLLLSLGRALWP